MPTPFEAEINSLLQKLGDPSLVADDLFRRWDLNLLTEEEQIDCAQFLVASGQYRALFERVNKLLSEKMKLPWAQLAEAVGYTKIAPTKTEIDAILEGAKEQESEEALIRSYQLDLWDRRFIELRAALQSRKAIDLAERKQALKDKLEFMRAQRMLEQEADILEEVQKLFPNEPEFAAEREAFEIRWAREVIANVSPHTDPTSELAWKADRLTPEQQTSKGMIVERAKKMAHANSKLAHDLAVCLHFMDFNSEAIEVLNLGPDSEAADWLRLELMIKARQFVNVLSEGSRLEVLYAANPDTAFAVVYARARALWGLGQSEMAIDLMSSLIRIKPNYKSAQALLSDWAGGDE